MLRALPERIRLADQAYHKLSADPRCQKLANEAALALGVATTQITIVTDRVRQAAGARLWANMDIDLEDSVCANVVRTNETLVAEDAVVDARISSIDGVRQGFVRGYCGAPIRWGDTGQMVGVFCAHDPQPRRWSAADVQLIEHYAAAVTALLGDAPVA